MKAADLNAMIETLTETAPQRLADLQTGKAITVRMTKRRGQYLDPVATEAEDRGLLAYCGDNVQHQPFERTPWRNPHKMRKTRTRDDVCDAFIANVLPTLDVEPLKGKALGCWCYPLRCHCDALAAKANQKEHTQ